MASSSVFYTHRYELVDGEWTVTVTAVPGRSQDVRAVEEETPERADSSSDEEVLRIDEWELREEVLEELKAAFAAWELRQRLRRVPTPCRELWQEWRRFQ